MHKDQAHIDTHKKWLGKDEPWLYDARNFPNRNLRTRNSILDSDNSILSVKETEYYRKIGETIKMVSDLVFNLFFYGLLNN